jgi:organic radical activating enzyme
MPPKELPFYSVFWKVHSTCNYRCSYCFQQEFEVPPPSNIEEVACLVSRSLKIPHEVKIAGGEVMLNTRVTYDVVSQLEKRGHWVSLCSNMSADVCAYKRIVERCNGRFYQLQASLHLEYASPDAFLGKCLMLRLSMPEHSRLTVVSVITRGESNIRKLGEIKRLFEADGIVFNTDLLVDQGGHYISYSEDEYHLIEECLGRNERYIESHGHRCRAGHSYFILLPNLDMWRCWDSYMRNDQQMYLGNMYRGGFSLDNSPIRCAYRTCSCPSPMIRHNFKLGEDA